MLYQQILCPTLFIYSPGSGTKAVALADGGGLSSLIFSAPQLASISSSATSTELLVGSVSREELPISSRSSGVISNCNG